MDLIQIATPIRRRAWTGYGVAVIASLLALWARLHMGPIAIGYLETVRMMVAWCELREDFRHFRTDRITAAAFLDERYPERPAVLRAKWRAALRDRVPEKKT